MERTIILHYHLFKNAGTWLDRILQKNFGDGWVTETIGGRDDADYSLNLCSLYPNPSKSYKAA